MSICGARVDRLWQILRHDAEAAGRDWSGAAGVSRSPLHLKAAYRVPGWSRLVRYRPEELCTFFHRECRFAASHAAAETAEAPVGFPSPFCHRPIRYRDRNTLVAAAPP